MTKQYGFYVDTERCVQCHACEIACKGWNNVELGIKWRRVADFWEGSFPAVSNRTISYSCMHCETAACVKVCPSGALAKRTQDGIVTVDQSKCIACRSCSDACPFDIPQYGPEGTMQKCDLCLERLERQQQPLCVATCPGEALKAGSMEDLMRIVSEKSGKRLRAKTNPSFAISGELTAAKFLTLFDQ